MPLGIAILAAVLVRLGELSLFYSQYCFVVGYGYVCLAFIVMWALGRAGIVHEKLVHISQ
jgi:hypothetical protein